MSKHPFTQCGSLLRKAHTTAGNSSFEGAGKLVLIVAPTGRTYYFLDLDQDEANELLEQIGSDIRVDEQGRAYEPGRTQEDGEGEVRELLAAAAAGR